MAKKPTSTAVAERLLNDGSVGREVYDPDTGEVVETPAAPAGELTTFAAGVVRERAALKIVRRVSLPVLPLANGQTIVAKMVDKIRTGKAIEQSQIKTAAQIVTIESMSGDQRTLIVNKVLEKELDETYPDAGYVGRWFQITRLPPKPGKRYPNFEIAEVELEGAAD